MSSSWSGARRALSDAETAARTLVRAPWLFIFSAMPPLAAKFLPAASEDRGVSAALSRVFPVLCVCAALTAFAVLFRRVRGSRLARAGDDATITYCYVLVACLIGSSCRGFATGRFESIFYSHASSDLGAWLRMSSFFVAALQLAGFAWTILVVLGVPSAPKHPELLGALVEGARGAARRPAAVAAWLAAAAAGDWLLVRGGGRLATTLSGGRFAEPTLLLVAWARQSVAYLMLCGAPLVAAETQ
jgi:hypothetical protein